MKIKTFSQIEPEKNFIIEDIRNGKCTVLFFDNIEKVKNENNDEETSNQYSYDFYKISVDYRENLETIIKNNYESWLDFAKDCEYEKLAAEIRKKRNELLAETDKEMCLDRIGLEVPEGNTFTSWISFFKTIANAITGKKAKYRQQLRDITTQEGFPYNVIWPTKDKEE